MDNSFFDMMDFVEKSIGIKEIKLYNQYSVADGDEYHGRGNCELNLSSYLGFRAAPLVLKVIIIFSIFDAFIDRTNHGFEGLPLNEKIKKIPVPSEIDLIKKSLYRIARVVRNKVIHAPSSIIESCEYIEIKNGKEAIKISYESLRQVFSLIFILIKYHEVGDGFFKMIVKSYYNSIVREMPLFCDTHQGALPKPYALQKDFYHESRQIYFIENLSFDPSGNAHIFRRGKFIRIPTTKDGKNTTVCLENRDDYLIKIESDFYLLPGFEISDSELIDMSQLKSWRLGDEWFAKKHIMGQLGIAKP